jgi:hypothetical protein
MSRRRVHNGELTRLEGRAGFDATPENVVRDRVADKLTEIAANLRGLPAPGSPEGS